MTFATAPIVVPGATSRAALVVARAVHWQRTRRLTMILLALWLATTIGTVFYARELAALTVFGWPLSFYLAAQGASLAYLAMIGAYALIMDRIDRRFARALDPLFPCAMEQHFQLPWRALSNSPRGRRRPDDGG